MRVSVQQGMLTSAPRHAMDLSVVAPSKFYDGSRKMNSVNIDSGYTYKYTVRWAVMYS